VAGGVVGRGAKWLRARLSLEKQRRRTSCWVGGQIVEEEAWRLVDSIGGAVRWEQG